MDSLLLVLLEWMLLAAYAGSALAAAGHALLNKRDPRAAWGWIAACWLFPLLGALIYWLFGINRIQTRARRLAGPPVPAHPAPELEVPGVTAVELGELVRTGSAVTRLPLLPGNRVEPLDTGAAAYRAMLDAIAGARSHLEFSTYLYLADDAGREFARALAQAQDRGVQVRVLLDGVADFWNRPRASRLLARHGVASALFLPPRAWPPLLHFNLRNHRKLLIADQAVAFTGGMNVCDGHWRSEPRAKAIADMQFRVEGPVVGQLHEVFRRDWRLATGESLPAAPPPPAAGPVLARAIADGPNEDLDRLGMVLASAMATAHRRIWIMTPYFIPTPLLLTGLQSAALRGVDVRVVLPQRSDQPWLDWATRHWLWQVLDRGVRVFVQPPPFAHTKLLVVDDYYGHFGSANMDTRSLRLNFELTVEAYEPALARQLAGHIAAACERGQELHLDALQARSLPVKLRDAACWLFSPYL